MVKKENVINGNNKCIIFHLLLHNKHELNEYVLNNVLNGNNALLIHIE